MKQIRMTIALILLMLFSVTAVCAQSGRITGKITDARTGEELIGVNVIIQGTTQGAQTDLEGNYRILNVRPGTYTLEVRYVGYQTQLIEEVFVRTDLTTEINVSLSEFVIEGEEVVVRARQEAVIRDLTSSESRVAREDIERLPVQEVGDIVQLQAGVTVGAGGAIHIRGGRATEVAYIVDGVRVTDDYDRSSGLRVENQAIQELQVVSGTFNAEYGQATSGIINIVTRSGNNNFSGNMRIWGGEYATNNFSLYPGAPDNFSAVDPMHQYNIEGSVSGPIIRDRLTFFVSGRRFRNTGWLYGRNAFSARGPLLPSVDPETNNLIWERGVTEVPASNPVNRYGDRIDASLPWYTIAETVTIDGQDFIRYRDSGSRDSSLVALNHFDTYSFQSNIQYNHNRVLRFNLITSYGEEWGRGYNHGSRLVPEGIPDFRNQNFYTNLKTTVTPSNSTFITANAAMRYNASESDLYGDPYDRRYYNYERSSFLPAAFQPANGRFSRFGTSNGFFNRSTVTYIGKIEMTSQINNRHLLKGGIEFQADVMDFQSYGLAPVTDGGNITLPDWLPAELREGDYALELGIPPVNTPAHEKWKRSPFLASGYLQDRIDYENLVINLGVRFDYFQPNGRIPASDRPNLTGAYDQRSDDFWKEASPKYQFSPRLGIAYPISSTGVIHFSYGYFFQVPDYNRLYNGDKLILESRSGVQGIFGNPDLKPEQSIKYELGLQQEIFTGISLDLTIFYEDKRDYVSSGPIKNTSVPSVRYGTWINRDYANIRGVTAVLNQRVSRSISIGFDYTFSIAEDSNSDPASEFFAAVARSDTSGQNLARFLTPANWDRTHVFNSTLFYAGNDWGFNILQRFSSGLPYTPGSALPRRVGITASGDVITNSMRMKNFLTIDLNTYKDFRFADTRLRVFFNVFNLFDRRNVNFVYGDSGSPVRPDPITIPQQFDEGFYNNPGHYSEPRRVQFGVQMSF
jgi:outer membrane receptor protein involved in Fe transport